MATADAFLSDSAEKFRLQLTPRLDRKERSRMGQFFTPPASAALLASFFRPVSGDVVLLDAGAGVGALTVAFIRHVLQNTEYVRSVKLVAYESAPEFHQALESILKDCVAQLKSTGIKAEYELREEDFIESATSGLADGEIFSRPVHHFTHAILNPPYKKLHSSSVLRKMLSQVSIDAVNLYSAFVWLAVRLLRDHGEIAAITPRSFCNGPYFKPFRSFLLSSTVIDRVHVYEKRNAAFSDDDVLQENILFHAVKAGKQRPNVLITQSSGADEDEGLSKHEVPVDKFVSPFNSDKFIHITPDEIADSFARQMQSFDTTLETLGLKVSTGPVVDFRLRNFLRPVQGKNDAPLLYPVACGKDGLVHWPPESSRKPIAIAVTEKTQPWLVEQGCYVLVRRFSAKEERHRVVATVYDPSHNGNGGGSAFLGIENHLNYYHVGGKGMDVALAKGLTIFLNSTLFDSYFRQFSGHTQVNSTDLRQILYPSRALLTAIGTKVEDALPPQAELDSLVNRTFNILPETMNAFEASKRLDDAKAILKAVNASTAQINDRSALCLLALADLTPAKGWNEATSPLRGITQMMDWFRKHYGKDYAPNTRETVRRQTMHQFVQMGLAIENPDKPSRPINSPKWCYKLSAPAVALIHSFGTDAWQVQLSDYLAAVGNLLARLDRDMPRIPVTLPDGRAIEISAGGQNELIKHIVEEFCPRFAPAGTVLYVGDAGEKFVINEAGEFAKMGIVLDPHGKMPDVVIHHRKNNWLLLIEAVTSHGPVDLKRRNELKKLFANGPGLVFVTAFPSRSIMVRYLSQISWESEVWIAEDPNHMIHFNGERFLGPY